MAKATSRIGGLGNASEARGLWLAQVSALSLLAVAGQPAVAAAQGVPEEPEAAVGEIVVTANRRAQVLSDVPISVNVVTGEAIASQGVSDLRDLAAYVPSLTVNDSPGTGTVQMRGLGTGSRNALFDNAVTIQVDGLNTSRSAQFIAPYFDLQRIEVLRGPQGVLFGKNATAGALSIVTANPTTEFSGSVRVGYELEAEGTLLEGVVSGPMTDTLSGRLAILLERAGGYIEDTNLMTDIGGSDTMAARGTLQWRPNDDLDVRLKFEAGSVDFRGLNYELAACTTNRARVLLVSPTEDCTANLRTARTALDGSRLRSQSVINNVDYQIGGHTLTSISAASRYQYSSVGDLDQTPAQAITRAEGEKFEQFFQELRLTSPDEGRLTYILGATVQRQRIRRTDITDLNAQVLPYTNATTAAFNATANRRLIQLADQTSFAYSAFGHVTFDVTEKFRLLGGVRYNFEEKEIDYDVTRALSYTNTIVTTPVDIHIRGQNRDESDFDPQVGIQYDVTDSLMGYLTASIVHKAGGFNVDEADGSAIATAFVYQPEEAESIEGGFKWSGRGASLNLAVFRTEISDLQVSTNDGVRTSVRNAAGARSQGAEIDGSWRVADFLTFSGSVAYLDATFISYPGGACTPLDAARIAPATCRADLSGFYLPFSPEWSGSIAADAKLPIGDDFVATLGATVNYKGEQFSSENGDETRIIDENTTLDLRAGFLTPDEGKGLRLIASNVFDEIVPTFYTPTPRAPGSTGAIMPRGRTILIEVAARF